MRQSFREQGKKLDSEDGSERKKSYKKEGKKHSGVKVSAHLENRNSWVLGVTKAGKCGGKW